MENSSLLIRIAQLNGIATSGVLTGCIATFSLATIPAILLSPTSLQLEQWRSIFTTGKSTGPPLAIFAFLNLSYVAWTKYSDSNANVAGSWRGYAVAAVATVSIMPYTIFVMGGINSKLISESAEVGNRMLADAEVGALLRGWALRNWIRSVFPLVGTAVGLWTALQ